MRLRAGMSPLPLVPSNSLVDPSHRIAESPTLVKLLSDTSESSTEFDSISAFPPGWSKWQLVTATCDAPSTNTAAPLWIDQSPPDGTSYADMYVVAACASVSPLKVMCCTGLPLVPLISTTFASTLPTNFVEEGSAPSG